MRLLEKSGVSSAKVILIPCVYADKSRDESAARTEAGANSGRVKLLFLGSVSLAKGLGQLFQVVKMLQREAVDFVVAGPIEVNIPDEVAQLPNVRFLGAVDKSTAEKLYRESDVFLFPTLSDGFGLTQLEALGHGLPVIASTHCGKVVEDGVSGLVLPEVTPEAIADAIMQLVRDRDFLHQLKANARVPDEFHPRHLAPALLALEKS
jgi:glycosyltransferase involved in cell wall biosynthesis